MDERLIGYLIMAILFAIPIIVGLTCRWMDKKRGTGGFDIP